MNRIGLLVLASLLVVADARAQSAPPGWQVERTQRTWAATSPPEANGDRVRLVFYPATKASGAFQAWFDGEVARRTAIPGAMVFQAPETGGQEATPLSPLLQRVVALSRFGQVRSTIVTNLGYEVGDRRQFVQIVMPAWPGKPRAAYLAAVERVTAAWAAGVVYEQSR